MFKQAAAAAAFAACFVCAAASASAASDAETAKFYYEREGTELTLSLDGAVEKDSREADLIVAAYDGGTLIKTEIIELEGDVSSLSMRDITIMLPYDAQALSVKTYLWAADGSCEPFCEGWELSDMPGTVMEWHGMVLETFRTTSGGLDKEEVTFIIFSSPDAEDYSNEAFNVNIGDTDIDSREFEYVKAYIMIDEDTGDYTVMDYELLDKTQKVFLPTSEVVEEEDGFSGYFEAGGERYELAEDVSFYVNGVEIWGDIEEEVERYIINNQRGSVELIDVVQRDGTKDGLYDRIMVSYTQNAIVDSNEISGDVRELTFKVSADGISDLFVDPMDDYVTVSVRDEAGNVLDIEDLTEYDVVSIDYDVSSDFGDSFFYDIVVSRKVVCGTVSERDPDKNAVVVNGIKYKLDRDMFTAANLELSTEYTMFLDAAGYIIYIEEGGSVPPTPVPGTEPPEQSDEFRFVKAVQDMYIQMTEQGAAPGGALSITTEGAPRRLSASVSLIENGQAAYTKDIVIPAGAERLAFNGEPFPYDGTPEKAVLTVYDGDTELYAAELPVIYAEKVYNVYGRVVDTVRTAPEELTRGNVMFRIERAEDFEDIGDIGLGQDMSDPREITAAVGTSGADEMHYIYSEAAIGKNADGTYTILALYEVGEGQTVSIPPESCEFDEYDVFKTDGSGARAERYRMSYGAYVYVNGVYLSDYYTFCNKYAYMYPAAEITLLDITDAASTSTDGRYDIMLLKYVTNIVVDSVELDGDIAVISAVNDIGDQSTVTIDLSAADTKLTLNGEQIGFDELKPGDVLSVGYDAVNGSIFESDFYDIEVSRESMDGFVLSRDDASNTLYINGKDYIAAEPLDELGVSLGESYLLYFDVYGRIAYAEETFSSDLFGTAIAMYYQSGKEYAVVRLINTDGEVVEYECRDAHSENEFAKLITGGSEYDFIYDVSEAESAELAAAGQTFCQYSISGDEIRLTDIPEAIECIGAEYNAEQNAFGDNMLDENVCVLDISDYLKDRSNDIHKLSAESIRDGETYNVYLYKADKRGEYHFALISEGDTDMADYDAAADPTYIEDAIGVAVAMWQESGDVFPTVQLVTETGETVEYECMTEEDKNAFCMLLTGTEELSVYGVTLESTRGRVVNGETVCSYSVKNGKISFGAGQIANGGAGTVFENGIMGETDISGAPVLYLNEYLNNWGETYILEASALTDVEYTAYTVCDGDGNAKLAVVMEGTAELPVYDPSEDETYVSEGKGIVIGIYRTNKFEMPMIRLITEDASIVEYPAKDPDETNDFYHVLTKQYGSEDAEDYNEEDITNRAHISGGIPEYVVSYSVQNGKVIMDDRLEAVGGLVSYDASKRSLNEYVIAENAVILDIEAYINGSEPAALTPEALPDGADYEAYLYGADPDTGGYGFVIVTAGTSSIAPSDETAIVSGRAEAVTEDGETYYSIPILVNGASGALRVNDLGDITVGEGDIIIGYSRSNEITDGDDIITVVDSSSREDYWDLWVDTMKLAKAGDLTGMIESNVVAEDNEWLWSTEDHESKVYFGAIYSKDGNSLKLMTGTAETETPYGMCCTELYNDEQFVEFDVWNVESSYVYDYSLPSDKNRRVYCGSPGNISKAKFDRTEETVDGKTYIVWSGYSDSIESLELYPSYAFVRTVNGEVSEVVYFLAP